MGNILTQFFFRRVPDDDHLLKNFCIIPGKFGLLYYM